MLETYEIGKPYVVYARHALNHTQNRMHADGLPQKLGFRGALVLGTAIYANMTRALVASLGDKWLGNAEIHARFLKVVCAGDRLRVETVPVAGQEGAFKVTAYNETANDEVCAYFETTCPARLPAIDALASLAPNEWEGPVTQDRSWDLVEVGKPYRSMVMALSREHNDWWKAFLENDLSIYQEGTHPPIHPAQVLRFAPIGSRNQYLGDNAVHSASKVVVRKVLRVGDTVRLLTVPAEKWEKKRNHWVTLYCAVFRDGEVCAEVYHTQIFKLHGT